MDADPILREYDARRAVFRAFAERMDFVIRESLSRAKIRTQSIEHRVKERNSLLSKLSRPGATYSCLNDVTDVCGVRVITYFATDVDRIGEVLKKEFIVDASNSTDKRIYTDPDRFGYRSLHYVLSMSPDRYRPFRVCSFCRL